MSQVLRVAESQPIDKRLKRAMQVIVIGLFCILLGRYILDTVQMLTTKDLLTDFQPYWTASKAISMGENPYTYLAQFNIFPYKYPPLFAVLLLPLTKLPILSAQRIWIIINEILLWSAVVLSVSLVRKQMSIWQLLVVGCAVLGFYPVYTSLKLGQVSILLYFLVTLSIWLWQRDKRVLAALMLALAGVVKVLPLILLVYLFWKREYRMTLYTILFAGILVILPDLVIRSGLLTQYVQSANTWYDMENSYYANQSVFAFLLRLMQRITNTPVEVSTLLTVGGVVVGCAMIGITFFSHLQRSLNPDSRVTILEIGIILTIIGFTNPVSWTHYFVWMLIMVPAFVSLLVEKFSTDTSRTSLTIAALGLVGFVIFSQPFRIARLLGYDVETTALSLDMGGVLLQSLFLYGTLLMWISSTWLYHTVSKPSSIAKSTAVI
jgi:hypothetical protein